ncbi:Clp protease N-terminal domain-containing protein [Rhodococcus opacus]|uniref:Clp protease N-terminal domain-containing protein n=1 Tax=Rhodococcus opacus TaxID=37919 RepID=UPI000B1FA827|nr:Clp protease N-terminal domain-containing protein [Rhodococcus opacus]
MFEKFSDQARHVVVLAAGAARTHHQNSVGTEHLLAGILDAGGPGAAALTSGGRHRPHSRASSTRSAHARAPPRRPGTSRTPAKTKKVLESSLRQTALLGHEQIGTAHLLLALLDDPTSTGTRILTDLTPLPISDMREHLRHELAHGAHPRPHPPHPHPAQRRRIHPRPQRRPHRRLSRS